MQLNEMRAKLISLILYMIFHPGLKAQSYQDEAKEEHIYQTTLEKNVKSVSFTSSDLPIIIIDTEDESEIPDEPKIDALMKIIHDTSKAENHIDDPPTFYSGHVGIEIRGNYSANLPQKPYGFETRDKYGENKNIPLFHMPKENDWILLANYNDKVMMRNTFSYSTFRKMGHYAPRTQYCEVVVNDSYDGIYVLTEKIKQDVNRINIDELAAEDIEGDEVTGGYIFKIDYYTEDDSWLGGYSPVELPGAEVYYVYHDPKAINLQAEQKTYLKDYIQAYEDVLYSDNFDDLSTGFRAFIDVKSFIDYFIISEISRNCDAYKKSKFYFKEKDSNGGLLHSGSVWDFDWAYKNPYGQGIDGSGWAYISGGWQYPTPDGWIERMREDTMFVHQLANRYRSLRGSFLHLDSINAYIDEQHAVLDQAQSRHYERWPILGINVGTPEDEDQPLTFEGEVVKFKTWIETRIAWLDEQLPEEVELPEEYNLEKEPEPEPVNSIIAVSTVKLRVFPNPADEYVYVESDKLISKVEMYSYSGTRIINDTGHPGYSVLLNLQNQMPGLYVLRISLANEEVLSKKIVIQ